jgi:hypothetical protein
MVLVRTLGISEISIGPRLIGPEHTTMFMLLLLTAVRAPRPLLRADLSTLLWSDAPGAVRSHRFRSLLHRARQADVPLECTETTVRLPERAELDFREFSSPPRGLDDIQRRAGGIGPILPGLDGLRGSVLGARLDDERDVITATVIRWVQAALVIAKAAGEWSLVEQLARAGREVDPFNEEAWLSLAEAQCLTSGRTRALRTLDEYALGIGDPSEAVALPAELLRRRVGEGDPLIGALAGERRRVVQLVKGASEPAARVIHFEATVDRAARPFGIVLALIAQLLEERGAAGCDPEAYHLLRRAVEAQSPNDCGDTLSTIEALAGALIELLAALSDESALILLIERAQLIPATDEPFWNRVVRSSANHRLLWILVHEDLEPGEASAGAPHLAVSRPIPLPSAPP